MIETASINQDSETVRKLSRRFHDWNDHLLIRQRHASEIFLMDWGQSLTHMD